MGYDENGLKQLEGWIQRQAVKNAVAAVDAKYGKPLQEITQERRAAAERQMNLQTVERNVAAAQKAFGKTFTDDFGQLGRINPNSEVMKVINANPGMPFLEACAIALVPRLQGDRNKQREELLKELDAAGKNRQAAGRLAPSTNQLPAKPANLSPEDIIRQEMQNSGLIP